MDKPEKPFNPLFKGAPPKIGKKKKSPYKKTAKPVSAPVGTPRTDDFLEAMSGVKPLPSESRERVRTLKPASPALHGVRQGLGHLSHQDEGAIGKESPLEIKRRAGSENEKKGSFTGRNATKENDFLEAMSGVTPLPSEPRTRVRARESRLEPANPTPDEARQVMDHLSRLVKGEIDMDITFSAEYMEGSLRGFDRELMKKLKRGEFPVQDHIDLHGLTRQEAQVAVKGFILSSYKLGLRCVLIIHGRGLNSPESFPVLKEGLPIWLGRGPVKRIVLAFSTARPYDGGTGAVYVLLRRR